MSQYDSNIVPYQASLAGESHAIDCRTQQEMPHPRSLRGEHGGSSRSNSRLVLRTEWGRFPILTTTFRPLGHVKLYPTHISGRHKCFVVVEETQILLYICETKE